MRCRLSHNLDHGVYWGKVLTPKWVEDPSSFVGRIFKNLSCHPNSWWISSKCFRFMTVTVVCMPTSVSWILRSPWSLHLICMLIVHLVYLPYLALPTMLDQSINLQAFQFDFCPCIFWCNGTFNVWIVLWRFWNIFRWWIASKESVDWIQILMWRIGKV